MEGTEFCFPQLNTSCRKSMSLHYDTMLLYILLSSSSLITVSLNMLVIISISHFRDLHTPTNFLLLSLAVSDFLVGLLVMPGEILFIGECWYLGNIMCAFYVYVTFIIMSSSVGNMVLISVDRYVAICDPLRYPTSITPRRVQICVTLCWACSVSYSSLILKDFLKQPDRYHSCDGECVIVFNYITGSVDLVVSFIGPVTVIIVPYSRVFVVAVSQARAMRSHIVTVTHRRSVTVTAKKSEMKAARTLGIVIVVLSCCWGLMVAELLLGQDLMVAELLGLMVAELLLGQDLMVAELLLGQGLEPGDGLEDTWLGQGQDTSSEASYLIFVLLLLYCNSLLNPVIYAFFYPWFRKAIKLIVTLNILQSDSSEAKIL
ncbi:trace amine-associated receptor 13c-like [Diretmus argenteus]